METNFDNKELEQMRRQMNVLKEIEVLMDEGYTEEEAVLFIACGLGEKHHERVFVN